MKTKQLLLLIGAVLIIALIFFCVYWDIKFKNENNRQIHDHEEIKYTLLNNEFIFEVVTTDESRTQGLSGRKEMLNDGMLFIFEKELRPYFWMKDMNFPLDFLWLRNDCVVELTPNVGIENKKKTFRPQQLVTSVLETKAGFIDQYNIEIGDCLNFASYGYR